MSTNTALSRNGFRGGSPPSGCPDLILDYLSTHASASKKDIVAAIHPQYRFRTVSSWLLVLRRNGEVIAYARPGKLNEVCFRLGERRAA